MKKNLSIILFILLISLLAACQTPEEVAEEADTDVLITFLNESITVKDAENGQMHPEDEINDVAKELLFQEIVLIEADKAGISYDDFDLEALVNQTVQLFEFDEEAIAFLTEKGELYNLSAEEYIDTIWRETLRKRLIVNNYLAEEIDFHSEKPEEEILAEIETVQNNLLAKYEDQIEYHF